MSAPLSSPRSRGSHNSHSPLSSRASSSCTDSRSPSSSPHSSLSSYSSGSSEGSGSYIPGGYHRTAINDTFNNSRYTVIRKLGWGHFSVVYLVADKATGACTALKIQKSAAHYTDAARDEIKLLEHLCEGEPCQNVIQLKDHFFHHGPNGKHMCKLERKGAASARRQERVRGEGEGEMYERARERSPPTRASPALAPYPSSASAPSSATLDNPILC